MNIEKNMVFKIGDRNIFTFNLRNSKGFGINVLNYGGIITDILVSDKNGNFENVVMKYRDLETYKENPSYFGALIGRTSGRISKGRVDFKGETLNFNKNYGLHQGHGGNCGFNQKVMDYKTAILKEEAYVEFTFKSNDLEEGYPGNLDLKIRYTITENNELKISYKGISDKDTLLNLTNHSYFNLSGENKESVLDHIMYVNSDLLIELDNTQVPTGEFLKVSRTPFDFNKEKKIGRDIDNDHPQIAIGCGYDHPWKLNTNGDIKLRLYEENSGRCMDVFTNQESVVLYSLNFPDDEVLEGGLKSARRGAIAIETQSPPIGINNSFIESSILNKGEEYNKETIYKFYTK